MRTEERRQEETRRLQERHRERRRQPSPAHPPEAVDGACPRSRDAHISSSAPPLLSASHPCVPLPRMQLCQRSRAVGMAELAAWTWQLCADAHRARHRIGSGAGVRRYQRRRRRWRCHDPHPSLRTVRARWRAHMDAPSGLDACDTHAAAWTGVARALIGAQLLCARIKACAAMSAAIHALQAGRTLAQLQTSGVRGDLPQRVRQRVDGWIRVFARERTAAPMRQREGGQSKGRVPMEGGERGGARDRARGWGFAPMHKRTWPLVWLRALCSL